MDKTAKEILTAIKVAIEIQENITGLKASNKTVADPLYMQGYLDGLKMFQRSIEANYKRRK